MNTMGDYKQLNRELIDSNRELKQLVATLQKELVLMRAELMEQHRIRVETEYNCRERLLTSLAKNFLASINEIDSNVNIMEILGYKDCIQNTNTASVGPSDQSGSTRSSRRSTQLVRDFRRTSAVCRQQSVVQMSPTRRGVHEEESRAIEEEENEEVKDTSGRDSGSDMELDYSINSDNVIDVDENDDSAEEIKELGCIHESIEEEPEVLDDEEAPKSNNADTKRKQKPLRDLSNHIKLNEDKTCQSYNITKRGKQRQRISDSENSIEMARHQELDYAQAQCVPIDMQVEDDLVNSMQRSLQVSHIESEFHETTIKFDEQKPDGECGEEKMHRQVVVRLQRYHEPVQQSKEKNNNEGTIIPHGKENFAEITRKNDAEVSLAITEFSMGNFLEASCSTPCHSMAARPTPAPATTATTTITPATAPAAVVQGGATKSSATRTDENTNSNSFDTSLSKTRISSRPSRRCTPRSLMEPSLRDKLRNASAEKIKPRPKKR